MWEYKIVHRGTLIAGSRKGYESEQEGLNELGKEGWELVATLPGGSLYFKRRKYDGRD